MFSIRDLSFAYDSEKIHELALKNVSLDIKAGAWWSIIGANGSGKSTLARHLNGLLTATSGTVLVNGLNAGDFKNHNKIRRQVGIVFQNPDNQIIGNTVEEDVAFGPENMGIDPDIIRERIKNALKQVGLEDYSKADPNNLSGGQKQRVAIAGALAMEPQALILDESTSMLDPQGCEEVFKVLKELHQKGMAIIMITHNMAEVACSDYVAVMNEGELVAVGSPQDIFAQVENLQKWHIELPLVNQIAFALLEADKENLIPRDKNLASVMDMAELVKKLVSC